MRIVLDTNVLMSAIFFAGKPKIVTDLVVDNKVDIFANDEIISEYRAKLDVIKDKTKIEPNLEYYNDFLTKVNISKKISRVDICRDKDDNKFIECAIDNRCLYIVSGDKDLTDLKIFDGIKILNVSDFLVEYNNK